MLVPSSTTDPPLAVTSTSSKERPRLVRVLLRGLGRERRLARIEQREVILPNQIGNFPLVGEQRLERREDDEFAPFAVDLEDVHPSVVTLVYEGAHGVLLHRRALPLLGPGFSRADGSNLRVIGAPLYFHGTLVGAHHPIQRQNAGRPTGTPFVERKQLHLVEAEVADQVEPGLGGGLEGYHLQLAMGQRAEYGETAEVRADVDDDASLIP